MVEFSISVHIHPSSIKFMRFRHGLNKRLYYIPYLFSKAMTATISSLLLRNNEHGLKGFSPSGPGMFYMHCLFCPALLIWYFIHKLLSEKGWGVHPPPWQFRWDSLHSAVPFAVLVVIHRMPWSPSCLPALWAVLLALIEVSALDFQYQEK